MLRRFFLLVLVVLCIGAAACTTKSDPQRGPFSMQFTDFAVHQGDMLYLKVVDVANGNTVGEVTPFEVTNDQFIVDIPGIIENGRQYRIDYFADEDGNGVADRSPIGDPPGVDHTWRRTGTGGPMGLSLSYAHSTDFTDITPF